MKEKMEMNKWKCKKCNSIKKGNLKSLCDSCYQKDYYNNNKIKIKNVQKQWYNKNKESKIIYQIKYLQINNYKPEKTNKQRLIRCIKRKTRISFPLVNKKCDFCDNLATEHHHYTNPLEFDKFNYICHNCHKLLNNKIVVRRINNE